MKNKDERIGESISETMGVTPDELNKIIEECVDAYNANAGKTVTDGLVEAIKVMRGKEWGELQGNPPVSDYERKVSIVIFIMGMKFSQSQVAKHLERAMLKIAEMVGMPAEERVKMAMATLDSLIDIVDSGHICTKCGKCGKKFDENGNEIPS